MPKVIETLLTSVGIPAEDIAKIVALPEAEQETFDVKPYTEKVKANYETQLKNSPEFFNDITVDKLPAPVKKRLEDAQFGRAAKIGTDKLLKGLGMTEADYADLPEETKEKFELLIPAIAEKYTKTKAGDKQLQQDLIAARKELEKYGGDYEKNIETKYQTQAEQKVTSAIFNAVLVSELSGLDLKIPASDIAATANQLLQSKYGFVRIGDFGVELRQKDNPEMKVLKPNSSHELTLKEALDEIATERNWKKEKEDDKKKGSGTFTVTPGNGGLEMKGIPAHLQEHFKKKIAAEK